MPAKKEYLSTKGQRALKITAGIIGGYFLSVAFHMMLGVLLPDRTAVILTGAFSVFILWVGFMILAFFARNGWKIWGIYFFSTAFCGLFVYFIK
ncbi:hypothetical protein [Dyadobacter sp. NIV53]|uniref:hypothetical protein n=1 Tax=Dyadobacter sp. NIV53 TaxID=2861765 RepID=UPI001C88B8FA|nr:hypothetical protein [Dyadobacter sp. NIV53]